MKGEALERNNLFPWVKTTKSGLDACLWIKLLIEAHTSVGRNGGSVITDWDGNVMDSVKLEATLNKCLIREHEKGMEFLSEVKSAEDIAERLSVLRSLRRASDTRDVNMKTSSNDIYAVSRWKKVESSRGKVATGSRKHYADFS